MTPIGHSLTGAALAALFTPNSATNRDKALLLGACVAAANIPDLPFPGWGREQNLVSHSVFVNAAIMAALASVLCRVSGRSDLPIRSLLAGGVLAWFSHLLLDSFYSHGMGIALLWPISSARLALPLPWFESWQGVPPPWDGHTFRVAAVEFLFCFPFFVFCLEGRRVRALTR